MLKLLHVSDLHFGPPYLPEAGEALQRIAPRLEPDIIVVSGDFTQRATREQFAAARAYLDRFPPVPKVVVPGNHDVPLFRVVERFRDPLGLYRQFISADLDTVLHEELVTIVALDSTAPHRSITNGRLGGHQLALCENAFQQAADGAARIVVVHHPFGRAPDYDLDERLPQSSRLLKQFGALGVDMILGGHLHRGYLCDSLDIHPHPSDAHHGILMIQCGTSTSRRGRARERQRNSFNRIVIARDQIDVTRYMYFADTDSFEPISRHAFPRRGHRLFG